MHAPALERITVKGYRSLVDVSVPVSRVTVVQGGNGSGKSNLYRALGLAVAAADGTLAHRVAAEGGMGSLLWAGPRRKGPRRVEVQVQWSDVRYTLVLGLPQTVGDDPFPLDPEVKSEVIELAAGGRWLPAAERTNTSAMMRDSEGRRVVFGFELWRGESMLTQIRDPLEFAVAADVQARLLQWRLYHEFRTGSDAPARTPQLGVRTPQLALDGADLAAAYATIWHVGAVADFQTRVAAAFDGARVSHSVDESGRFTLFLDTGLARPLAAAELSDGTLRYLCLLTALSSPRPATLVAVNEPETSLHPQLLPPLAEMLAGGAGDSQIWVTTHSAELADHLAAAGDDVVVHRLARQGGETQIIR